MKRVASAVGEGSVVISDVHRYLTLHQERLPLTARSSDPDHVLRGWRVDTSGVVIHPDDRRIEKRIARHYVPHCSRPFLLFYFTGHGVLLALDISSLSAPPSWPFRFLRFAERP